MGVFSKCRIPLGKTCKETLFFPPDFPEKTIEATPQLQTHTNFPPPSPANKKIRQIHFEFAYFSFFLTHDKYLHTLQQMPQFPEKNHTRFQTKIGKEYTRFQTKTAQNSPDGEAHTFLGDIREQRHAPSPPGLQAELLQQLAMLITKAKIRLFHPIWLWLFYAEKGILFKKFRKFRVLCLLKMLKFVFCRLFHLIRHFMERLVPQKPVEEYSLRKLGTLSKNNYGTTG